MAMRIKTANIALAAVLLSFFIVDWLILVQAADAGRSHVVNTRYTRLVFNSAEDVRKFNRKIDFATGGGLGGFFSTAGPKEIENELIGKIDALFGKVQQILDMRRKMEKVRVNVYSNSQELHDAYFAIYRKECTVRGWYLYERNTVYLNVDDVHEGMLAHEFAHAIIDHYLTVRPPRASAEILARYVDKHLFEEVVQQ